MRICCLPHGCNSDMSKLCCYNLWFETWDVEWLRVFCLSLRKSMFISQALLIDVGKICTPTHCQHLTSLHVCFWGEYKDLGYFCPSFSEVPLPHHVLIVNRWVLVVINLNRFSHFLLSSDINEPVLFLNQSGTETALQCIMSQQLQCFKLLLLFSSVCGIKPTFVCDIDYLRYIWHCSKQPAHPTEPKQRSTYERNISDF